MSIEYIKQRVHCYESISLANDDVAELLGIVRQQAAEIERLKLEIEDMQNIIGEGAYKCIERLKKENKKLRELKCYNKICYDRKTAIKENEK